MSCSKLISGRCLFQGDNLLHRDLSAPVAINIGVNPALPPSRLSGHSRVTEAVSICECKFPDSVVNGKLQY